MTEVLTFLGRALAYLLLEVIFRCVFYWLGWPIVKLASRGQFPKGDWRSENTERNWVCAVGIAAVALFVMLLWGQLSGG